MTRDIDRRTFLRAGAVASLGLGGLAAGASAQDDSGGDRAVRRMAFEKPEAFSDDYIRRVVLLTDRHQNEEVPAAVTDCEFSAWSPGQLRVWEGLIIEWQNEGFGEILTEDPEVRAERMVETRITVNESDDPVELGTPFIVSGRIDCPGDYVGVTASEVPGLRIRTGPGVSTQG